MKKRNWYLFTITLPQQYYDIIIGQLSLLGFSGFVEQENTIECYIPAQKPKEQIKKKTEQLLKKLSNEFPALTWNISVKTVKEQNWNKQWEEKTGIVEVTPNMIVKPSWKKLRKCDQNKIVLHIDPKMAFGTGHHETTRLTLGMIERYIRPDINVLDFGCGTGILAIACAKLGAGHVVAIDNDPWAVDNAKDNIKMNNVHRTVEVINGSVSKIPRRKYSLIVANIDEPTIYSVLPALSKRMNTGSIVIFSGILTKDGESLISYFAQHHLIAIDIAAENEWLAIALSKL